MVDYARENNLTYLLIYIHRTQSHVTASFNKRGIDLLFLLMCAEHFSDLVNDNLLKICL